MEKFNEIYTDLDEYQKLTPWQLHNKGIDPDKQSRDKLNSDWLIRDIGGFFQYYPVELFQRSKTEQSAVTTTIVLLRFKADKGNFPDNLNELITAGFLKELPQDPYNEGTLTYKRVGESFILYSLGPNFKDDGGQAFRDNKGRIEMWSDEGDTVFWPVEKVNK